MKSNVARWFEKENIVISDEFGEEGMKPAEYATAYDVVGYDDSGFMGNFFTEQVGAIEVDVEHFLSHMVPNSTWVPPHEDAHAASVRGEIETLMVEAIVLDDVNVTLRLGKVGYQFDPYVVTSKDGYGGPKPPDDVKPRAYRVTKMRFFKDLGRYTNRRLRRLESRNLSPRNLRGLDTVVLANNPVPRDPDGGRPRRSQVVARLKDYVKDGGNLILTDRSMRLLPGLGVVKRNAVDRTLHNAGHVDIEDFEDPYLNGVHHTASQTYYEVPLGFSVDEDASPHFTVDRTAWEEAGGKTVGYITDEERVGLGRVRVDKGTVGIIGALLPNPTEKFDHFFGLANYAVTVAGGQILNNMIKLGK